MFRNRFLLLFGGCLLAASAALADDVGFVDCSNHPDDIQVFGKPRRTPDVIASVPCGTRFTILVYGFVFSRIQTSDGKVGYVYSNLIAVDRAATVAQQNGSVRMATEKSIVPSSSQPVAKPIAQAQPHQPAPAAPAATQAPAQPQSTPAPPVASISNVPESSATAVQPTPPAPAPIAPPSAPAQPQAAPVLASPAPAQPQPSPSPAFPAPVSNAPEMTTNVAAQPERPASAQPEPAPAPAEPPAPAVRPANDRSTWEKPLPSARRRAPLLEFYGGYAFARVPGSAGATSTNLNGAMGSFGWNLTPWLQILGDSSYNVVTVTGTKTVLYGNHFGPRYFHRSHNRWGLTPFVEALVGGSRVDTSVAGSSAYNTSINCLSYKAGGGLDVHPSRHIDIRLFDVDYYRTAFGANLHQNNYWASAGIVLRLFGGGSE
jgi:hypothetical protein